MAPFVVPFSTTEAPGTFPIASLTTPFTLIFCAYTHKGSNIPKMNANIRIPNVLFCFSIMNWGLVNDFGYCYGYASKINKCAGKIKDVVAN